MKTAWMTIQQYYKIYTSIFIRTDGYFRAEFIGKPKMSYAGNILKFSLDVRLSSLKPDAFSVYT